MADGPMGAPSSSSSRCRLLLLLLLVVSLAGGVRADDDDDDGVRYEEVELKDFRDMICLRHCIGNKTECMVRQNGATLQIALK